MNDEVTSAALQRLLGINKSVLGELVEKGIAVRGAKRGSYRLETVTRYCPIFATWRAHVAARKPPKPAHGSDRRKPL